MSYKDYKELIVWQKSMLLSEKAYELIKTLPSNERYCLSDQIRRSAISIPSNIAEGHGRNSKNEFSHFLAISRGSLSELETQLILGERIGFFQIIKRAHYLNCVMKYAKCYQK
ncbi:MAG: four helix bundle protein [Eubacterium sp.]|nr:four helix bundle protein [Eubacterium sp.]